MRIVNTKKDYIDFSDPLIKQKDSRKPTGLWYAKDYEWIDYCKGCMDERIYKNNIAIEIEHEKVLKIKTFTDLVDFFSTYNKNDLMLLFDWEKVARSWKGIEIMNYKEIYNDYFKYKMDTNLFLLISGWDVSSGCIWDLSAVKSWKLLS